MLEKNLFKVIDKSNISRRKVVHRKKNILKNNTFFVALKINYVLQLFYYFAFM